MTTKQKIAALRGLMHQRGLYAYLVPSTDPHMSEYVPVCWQRRAWLSGFTGSAGELIVTADAAGLWTDGRYFLQAEAELKNSGIRLYRTGEPGVPSLHEFLGANVHRGEVVGADPRVYSHFEAMKITEALAVSGGELKFLDLNLVDILWSDRPQPNAAPLQVHPVSHAGESTQSKLRRLRAEMKKRGADAHVVTTLDAIAWLFNVRGRDVEYNPFVLAYGLVTMKDATLFVSREKVSAAAARKLGPGIALRDYEEYESALQSLAAERARVWVDGKHANRWVTRVLGDTPLVIHDSPIFAMKAKKNEVEQEGMRQAHVQDGVAMVRFLRWFEAELPKGQLTEISAAAKLAEFRAEGALFQGLSFRTISGYGAHGALPHYSVNETSNVPIKPDGLYVLDSGGQYTNGTTDITRTLLLGKTATKEQRDRYTRVLKGHIALARAKFPAGIRGIRLDTLARTALWDSGLDYNHGTGHGVGAYISVHEGPQSITPPKDIFGVPLEPGNVLSNEPGYYKAGEYGIRIENLILVVPDVNLSRHGTEFLRFETITLCPIDVRPVERSLLTTDERAWLNGYHAMVSKKLSPHLAAADKAWLRRACAPI